MTDQKSDYIHITKKKSILKFSGSRVPIENKAKEEYKAEKKVGLGKVVDRTNLAITEKAYLAIEAFLSQTIDEVWLELPGITDYAFADDEEFTDDRECMIFNTGRNRIIAEAERMRDLSIKGKR